MPDPSGEAEAGHFMAAKGAPGPAGGDDDAQQDNTETPEPHRLIQGTKWDVYNGLVSRHTHDTTVKLCSLVCAYHPN